MAQRKARFVWKQVTYTIPADTPHGTIILTNGEVLTYHGFVHGAELTLSGVTSLGFSVIISPGTPPAAVAAQLKAVLAEELGHCPDHPLEHGDFCSKCGKPITAPPIFPQIKPFPLQGHSSPVNVMGNEPCPNCHKALDHDVHASICPNCGQKLNWTCRSGMSSRCVNPPDGLR